MGSFECQCKSGYKGDGVNSCNGAFINHTILLLQHKAILDINECSDGSHRCADAATCKNTAGSYVCTCVDGFQGDGMTCEGTLIIVTCNT